MMTDVTEQKRAEAERERSEERLRASEEQYRRIVETAQEGIWIIEPDATTSFVNERMAAMLGYEPDEVMDRSCFDFVYEADRGIEEANLRRRERGKPATMISD